MAIASMLIATFPKRHVPALLAAVPADRSDLGEAPGCVFAKVMGTSKQGTTRTSVQLNRWTIFAVWEDRGALEAFLDSSATVTRWKASARSFEAYALTPLSARGNWDSLSFPDLPAPEAGELNEGTTAVLTRAAVKPSKWVTFSRAIGPVDDLLQDQPGCSFALGMGEWPIGEQATFSVWESAAALEAFAYDKNAHAEVIKRTYREGWYSEELFARFSVETL